MYRLWNEIYRLMKNSGGYSMASAWRIWAVVLGCTIILSIPLVVGLAFNLTGRLDNVGVLFWLTLSGIVVAYSTPFVLVMFVLLGALYGALTKTTIPEDVRGAIRDYYIPFARRLLIAEGAALFILMTVPMKGHMGALSLLLAGFTVATLMEWEWPRMFQSDLGKKVVYWGSRAGMAVGGVVIILAALYNTDYAKTQFAKFGVDPGNWVTVSKQEKLVNQMAATTAEYRSKKREKELEAVMERISAAMKQGKDPDTKDLKFFVENRVQPIGDEDVPVFPGVWTPVSLDGVRVTINKAKGGGCTRVKLDDKDPFTLCPAGTPLPANLPTGELVLNELPKGTMASTVFFQGYEPQTILVEKAKWRKGITEKWWEEVTY